MRQGEGQYAVAPGTVAVIKTTEAQGACGQVIEGAPKGAVVSVSAAQQPEDPGPAPANLAAVVEAAGWRLDETLPPADAFTPTNSPAPANQRGVSLGSVVKVKRKLAPPILVGSGVRGCQGALVVMDRKAAKVLSSVSLSDRCATIKVLPPGDLDGDGVMEVVAYSDDRTEVYRLAGTSQVPQLEVMGSWACSAQGTQE